MIWPRSLTSTPGPSRRVLSSKPAGSGQVRSSSEVIMRILHVVPIDGGFLYDITLDDGTVIKDLNYDGLQKYIKDHEDVGYDFKF